MLTHSKILNNMHWIDLYKLHINPEPSAYEIHMTAQAFGLGVYVPHWDEDIRNREQKILKEKINKLIKWISDNKIMNAKEARQKAESINENKNTITINEINKLIKQKVDRGEFQIWFDKAINDSIKKYYLDKGYTIVDDKDPREVGNSFKISW